MDKFAFEAAVVADAGGWARGSADGKISRATRGWTAAVRRLIQETDGRTRGGSKLTGELRELSGGIGPTSGPAVSASLRVSTGDEIDSPALPNPTRVSTLRRPGSMRRRRRLRARPKQAVRQHECDVRTPTAGAAGSRVGHDCGTASSGVVHDAGILGRRADRGAKGDRGGRGRRRPSSSSGEGRPRPSSDGNAHNPVPVPGRRSREARAAPDRPDPRLVVAGRRRGMPVTACGPSLRWAGKLHVGERARRPWSDGSGGPGSKCRAANARQGRESRVRCVPAIVGRDGCTTW